MTALDTNTPAPATIKAVFKEPCRACFGFGYSENGARCGCDRGWREVIREVPREVTHATA